MAKPQDSERVYICIDLKSYYASVECVSRGLDPLKARLLVADESRSDKTICLAVSPALKEIGVPGRPRLFEARQKIYLYEKLHNTKVDYIVAPPRMAEYERISVLIYSIYLQYVSSADIHVYSIDECFIDCTGYLHFYRKQAEAEGVEPAHLMAMTIIRDVLHTTGITATAGIGTNMYLAKVAMDIVAKKSSPDKDGVRIAELNEDSYKYLLWDHKPLTDFWQIGSGKARRLQRALMFTMGDVAERSLIDEEWFYKTFGIDGEILVDHAWGIEPVTMSDVKSYKSDSQSMSNGQVLPRAYEYDETCLVMREMIDVLCRNMYEKNKVSSSFSWWVSYDYRSLEKVPGYNGPVSADFYGRLHPGHSKGTISLVAATNSAASVTAPLMEQFEQKTDHRLLFRRLGICANDTHEYNGIYQLNMFTDYEDQARERRMQWAMQKVRHKYGNNAIIKGMDLLDGATTIDRNNQIGGHSK
ncbi:MAG: DNA methylase [Firmicutes bacterium]|nr:DNA methylase [Bacillota bacterium]